MRSVLGGNFNFAIRSQFGKLARTQGGPATKQPWTVGDAAYFGSNVADAMQVLSYFVTCS